MNVDKKIQDGRKVATAYRKLSKKLTVTRDGGTVKLSSRLIVQNLPEEVAIKIEGQIAQWITLLGMTLKSESQTILENAYGADGEIHIEEALSAELN